jgi:hypothetical protein
MLQPLWTPPMHVLGTSGACWRRAKATTCVLGIFGCRYVGAAHETFVPCDISRVAGLELRGCLPRVVLVQGIQKCRRRPQVR